MKFSGTVGNGPLNKLLNFGAEPDHGGMHCPNASIVCKSIYYDIGLIDYVGLR